MKHFIRLPLRKLTGPYKAHQEVYAVAKGGRPIWRRFPDHALVLAEEPSEDHPSKPYDPSPVNGMGVRFSLLANVAVERGEYGKTKRIDPILSAWIESGRRAKWGDLGHDIGREWLLGRQERNGFRLIQLDQANYSALEFMRAGKPIRIGVVDFSGTLEVVDQDKFREAMLNGIGHSKAWGCGLLLCNRIDNQFSPKEQ